MSAPVDVLAVMQRTESCARLYYQRPDAYGRETPADKQARLDEEAREARAAVAELVEACRKRDKARDALGLAEEFFEWGDDEIISAQKALDAANKKYRKALAKFGGAA